MEENVKFYLDHINGRRSFGGKCYVVEQRNGDSHLYSYETKVASFHSEQKEVVIHGWHSNTTQSHINAFLDYYGFEAMTKKEILSKVEENASKN